MVGKHGTGNRQFLNTHTYKKKLQENNDENAKTRKKQCTGERKKKDEEVKLVY